MQAGPVGLGNNFVAVMAEERLSVVAVVLVVMAAVVAAAAVVVAVESEVVVGDWAPEVPLSLVRGWPFPKAPENTEYHITIKEEGDAMPAHEVCTRQ
jgi:hypothetical protein